MLFFCYSYLFWAQNSAGEGVYRLDLADVTPEADVTNRTDTRMHKSNVDYLSVLIEQHDVRLPDLF